MDKKMPYWCPNCEIETGEEADNCSICGEELVDNEPNPNMPTDREAVEIWGYV